MDKTELIPDVIYRPEGLTMSSTNETISLSAAPVDPQQRIEAVDMVRGFALFGVLFVHLFNFGAYSIIWNEPLMNSPFR